jgi:RNA polymerase-binding transcription factor DksA
MTDEQRKHLEQRLLEERKRVTDILNRYAAQHEDTASEQDLAGDLTKMPLHMADQGTDTMQQELDAVMVDRESHNLNEIDAALQRLYEHPDQFGIDERTGEEIPFERLDIVPWARTR